MSGYPGEIWNTNAAGVRCLMKYSISEEQDKYPIHFAAESLDTASLRTLLEFDPNLANQKYEDLTPLHIVVDSINSENLLIVFEAIKVLIKYKADFNCPASKTTFHTPFSLLLKKLIKVKNDKKLELLDWVIANCPTIDLDTYRNGEARTLVEKHYPDLLLRFQEAGIVEDYGVNNKDQIFAKLMKHLEADANQFILELRGLQKDPRLCNVFNEILRDGLILEETISRGLEVGVSELLQLGADVNRSSRGSTYTPIGIACQRGHWKILKLLSTQPGISFQNNNNCKSVRSSNTNPLLHIVVKNLDIKRNFEACDYNKCFDFLINNINIDVNEQDESGNTALHYAVRYKNAYAIKKLLEKSAYIGSSNIFKALPIRDIPPDLLEFFFDSCITTNGERQGDDEYEIRIDYSCLVPPKLREVSKESSAHPYFVKELSPIQYMADTKELRHLIQHPLISSFLFLKWFRLSPIFYANLAFYSIYCVTLTSYIVFYFDEDTTVSKLLRMMSLLGAVYVLVREIIQFLIAPLNYIKSPENYLEIGLIILTWVVLCSTFCDSYDKDERKTVQHVFGALTIMFAAVELSLLVGSLPFFSISTHMVMLKTVSMSFLRGLALYSIILVAFAFSFYMLFSGESMQYTERGYNDSDTGAEGEDELNKFIDPGRAIIKTIVMFTGEFEASSMHFHQNPLSYLIFVLFLFFMSIVVLNLLNGLAVSDTQIIKSEAELNNWLERTKLLINYEKNMFGKNNSYCQNILIKLACMKEESSIISMFPDFLPMHAVYIKVNENPANQMMIPIKPVKAYLAEGGEMYPVTSNRGDFAKRLEAPVKALSCCFAWKKCAVMDKKIVKYAQSVLVENERRLAEEIKIEQQKQRLDNIEMKLNEILKVLLKD